MGIITSTRVLGQPISEWRNHTQSGIATARESEGRPFYRPPGNPVLVGSDTFGRVQSGIPTQRRGPRDHLPAVEVSRWRPNPDEESTAPNPEAPVHA